MFSTFRQKMLAPFRVSEDNKQGSAYSGVERRIGRIDRPPDRRAHARLPEDFGQRFLIFVDTEEEFDWEQPLARENVAVTAIDALPEAHRFFRSAGAKPAYMVDYPVVNDERAAATMREMHESDGTEIGTQLHPWVNPPFDEDVTGYNSFTGNLPLALQQAKLAALTDKIEGAVGKRPIAYRAGRYGIGEKSAELLEKAGYRMDASVRSHFDYHGEGGPDFSGFETDLFWAGPGRSLLEMPLSAGFVGPLKRWGRGLFAVKDKVPLMGSALARTGLLQRVSLTPEDYPLDLALRMIDIMIEHSAPIFSLSYHSPSVVPGHTPYVRDEADLKDFYRWWDGVFEKFAKHGVEAAAATDVIAAADAAR